MGRLWRPTNNQLRTRGLTSFAAVRPHSATTFAVTAKVVAPSMMARVAEASAADATTSKPAAALRLHGTNFSLRGGGCAEVTDLSFLVYYSPQLERSAARKL